MKFTSIQHSQYCNLFEGILKILYSGLLCRNNNCSSSCCILSFTQRNSVGILIFIALKCLINTMYGVSIKCQIDVDILCAND